MSVNKQLKVLICLLFSVNQCVQSSFSSSQLTNEDRSITTPRKHVDPFLNDSRQNVNDTPGLSSGASSGSLAEDDFIDSLNEQDRTFLIPDQSGLQKDAEFNLLDVVYDPIESTKISQPQLDVTPDLLEYDTTLHLHDIPTIGAESVVAKKRDVRGTVDTFNDRVSLAPELKKQAVSMQDRDMHAVKVHEVTELKEQEKVRSVIDPYKLIIKNKSLAWLEREKQDLQASYADLMQKRKMIVSREVATEQLSENDRAQEIELRDEMLRISLYIQCLNEEIGKQKSHNPEPQTWGDTWYSGVNAVKKSFGNWGDFS